MPNDTDDETIVVFPHQPTLGHYSERELRIMHEDLNPENPEERVLMVAIERRLARLSGD